MSVFDIVGILAFLSCGYTIVLQNQVATMSHGQHKHKKRSHAMVVTEKSPRNSSLAQRVANRSFPNAHPVARLSSLETSTNAQAKQAAARVVINFTSTSLTSLAAEVIMESNLTKEEKRGLLTLLGQDASKVWPLTPMPPLWSNTLPNGRPPISHGGPMSHYLDWATPEQIQAMQAAGILDKHYRWHEAFLCPILMVFFNFFLGFKAHNINFATLKFQIISMFCSFYAIKTCPFTPGDSLRDVKKKMFADDLSGPSIGSALQSPEYEEELLRILKLLKRKLKGTEAYNHIMNPLGELLGPPAFELSPLDFMPYMSGAPGLREESNFENNLPFVNDVVAQKGMTDPLQIR